MLVIHQGCLGRAVELWHTACGAQNAPPPKKKIRSKSRTANALSRNHDPVTQNNPQTLSRVIVMSFLLNYTPAASLYKKNRADQAKLTNLSSWKVFFFFFFLFWAPITKRRAKYSWNIYYMVKTGFHKCVAVLLTSCVPHFKWSNVPLNFLPLPVCVAPHVDSICPNLWRDLWNIQVVTKAGLLIWWGS